MIERILAVLTYLFRPRNWTDVSPQHNYYFTLIELLVVIAIMVILLGLALPVFEKMLESSRTVTCISQEKQLYLALRQYAYNFDGYIPPGYGGSPSMYWASRLVATGHLSDTKLVTCPSTQRSTTGSRNISLNGGLGTWYNLRGTYRPSWLYLAMDTRGNAWYTINYYPGYPHTNRTNIVFVDGHAKTHPYGTVGHWSWSHTPYLPWRNTRGWIPSGPEPW